MEKWRSCAICKKEIPFGSQYYECSVSTCTQKRTGLAFCSILCWSGHVPVLRHRESWAVEKVAPTKAEWEEFLRQEALPKKKTSRRKQSS